MLFLLMLVEIAVLLVVGFDLVASVQGTRRVGDWTL